MTEAGCLSLGSRLKRLSDHLYAEVAEIYQQLDIELNPRFFPLFSLLHSQGAQTITGAAKKLGVTHAAISKISTEMIRSGLIQKKTDPNDERRQLLTISRKGQDLARQLQPIWDSIRDVLNSKLNQQKHPILAALAEFESMLNSTSLAEAVIERTRQPSMKEVNITTWDPKFKSAFYDLNIEWLEAFFPTQICERDYQQLQHPESYYLSRGGVVLFAVVDNKAIGCCALEYYSDDVFYLTKTAVTVSHQGQGIGRKLIIAALDKARSREASEVCLETSSSLQAANHLYQQLGFTVATPPQDHYEFERVNTFMRLVL